MIKLSLKKLKNNLRAKKTKKIKSKLWKQRMTLNKIFKNKFKSNKRKINKKKLTLKNKNQFIDKNKTKYRKKKLKMKVPSKNKKTKILKINLSKVYKNLLKKKKIIVQIYIDRNSFKNQKIRSKMNNKNKISLIFPKLKINSWHLSSQTMKMMMKTTLLKL